MFSCNVKPPPPPPNHPVQNEAKTYEKDVLMAQTSESQRLEDRPLPSLAEKNREGESVCYLPGRE
jgi:hypothetical protein